MQKRYFKLLPDTLIYELDGETVAKLPSGEFYTETHRKFIEMRTVDPIFADENRAGWNWDATLSGENVRAIVRVAKVGDVVELDEDDWKRLARSVKLGTTYNPVVAASLRLFGEAILGATQTKPAPPTTGS